MDCRCFCGAQFATLENLRTHGDEQGHRIMCSCGRLFKDLQDVRNHHSSVQIHTAATSTQRGHPRIGFTEHPALTGLTMTAVPVTAPPTIGCKLCKKTFRNAVGLRMHFQDTHAVCPTCKQVFASESLLTGHQKAANQYYCDKHDLVSDNATALRRHGRAELHFTGFECVICDRSFGTQQGFDDHIKNASHPQRATPEHNARPEDIVARVEESKLYCEARERKFKNIKSFRQHKESLKHKPLSDLQCPIADACRKIFTSPSALLTYLESGRCKSDMNRLKLNALVHMHDTARHITHQENAADAITAGNGVAGLISGVSGISIVSDSSQSGVVLTPDDSDANSFTSTESGVLIPTSTTTTSCSRASSFGGLVLTPSGSCADTAEWSLITDSLRLTPGTTSVVGSSADTITPDSNQRWPCGLCSKTFRKKEHLLDHLNSPAHAPKMFHCPTAVVGSHASGNSKKFKTLSGMAQHIEVGACVGGKGTLDMIVVMFESEIKAATGKDVKLLRTGGQASQHGHECRQEQGRSVLL